MRIRVIDYIGNEGGGVRFSVELIRGFAARAGDRIEVVGHAGSLAAYRRLLGPAADACTFVAIPPAPSTTAWRFDVPRAALGDCDVAWLPWVHRHRLPDGAVGAVVGSFHDAIMLAEPSVRSIFQRHIPDETETTRRWLDGDARVVVSSRATVAVMARLFDIPAARLDVVPVSGDHAHPDTAAPVPAEWAWAARPFILCPANISPHKNHEALITGVAEWGAHVPLVLTGSGADLPTSRNPLKRWVRHALEPVGLVRRTRATELRRVARRAGLRAGRSLIPVGYISDERYYALLHRAWAVVMPTLAEGGGSFPVEEAVRCGVPVICSDIPPVREHMERLGASVLWFDPRRPAELAARLAQLAASYDERKASAVRQVAALHRRSWADAADEYRSIFAEVVASPSVSR